MKKVMLILVVLWSGFYGYAVAASFKGDLEKGLGAFIIGTFFAVLYIVAWIIYTSIE